jgi:hypothetical protein
MLPVQFPSPAFRIRQQENYDEIFDTIRKRWLVLTPEEWVRQNFIAYLVQTVNVVPSLISIEKEISVGELKKRFDIVVYTRDGLPWMLIECKSMDINLTGKTLDQMLAYLSEMRCPFVIITNGTYTYGWKITGQGCILLEKFPEYPVVFP